MICRSLVWLALVLTPAAVFAQEMRLQYPAPPSSSYIVTKDVQFAMSGGVALRLDLYRPASSGRAPTLIFFNSAFGADQRQNAFYTQWAQLAASKGITAIVPDLRMESTVEDFVALLGYIRKQTGDNGIDPAALAVYAGSGNVSRALPIVEDPRSTMVKSAVMYYGAGEVAKFRLDLPLLYVRAGLDRLPVNRAISELVARAVAQNAPVTLVNHAGGYHAFEMFNDDDATRQVMEQTIEFVKRTTSTGYQEAIRRGMTEATAAGQVATGEFKQAIASYAALVGSRPEDARLRLSYGEALLGGGEFAVACAELEKLKGKGLGYRDLGLPAARACMQKGDAEAAIAWLQSIPQRFLPREIESDPVFAPIRTRAEFKALFQTR